jgi:hypothetical protein
VEAVGQGSSGAGNYPAARQAWEQDLEAARAHGDKQARKMTVFLKKLDRQAH